MTSSTTTSPPIWWVSTPTGAMMTTGTVTTSNAMMTVAQAYGGNIPTRRRPAPDPSLEEQLLTLSGMVDALERDHLRLKPGPWRFTIDMPDGAVIEVDGAGNYRVVDADAKVAYKANRQREFNRYINASDLLEEFIGFVGGVGRVDKQGFLKLPVELFIRWLVIRAAEADGDDAPEDTDHLRLALRRPARPRCGGCGRFISARRAARGLLFCSANHFAAHEAKHAV